MITIVADLLNERLTLEEIKTLFLTPDNAFTFRPARYTDKLNATTVYLPPFKTPDDWYRYTLSSNQFSFMPPAPASPSMVELWCHNHLRALEQIRAEAIFGLSLEVHVNRKGYTFYIYFQSEADMVTWKMQDAD